MFFMYGVKRCEVVYIFKGKITEEVSANSSAAPTTAVKTRRVLCVVNISLGPNPPPLETTLRIPGDVRIVCDS